MSTHPTDHRTRTHALIALGVVAVALPAAACPPGVAAATATSRPTITVDRACYVRTGPQAPRMRMTGSGFAPNSQVTVTDSTGTLDATTSADTTGAVNASFAGPSLILKRPGQMRDTIVASQRSPSGAPLTARTTTHVSIRGAGHGATDSARGLRALREPTDWVFSGWPVDTPIYVHYLHRHRAVARAWFGRTSAPCGVLHARRPLYPGAPAFSSYPTQIDTAKRFSTRTRPRFTLLQVGLKLEL